MAKKYAQTMRDRMDESRGMKRKERKRYYDADYMVKNDPNAIACAPTEIMTKYYPENPSYFSDTYYNDSIDGIDKEMKMARNMPGTVKGEVL